VLISPALISWRNKAATCNGQFLAFREHLLADVIEEYSGLFDDYVYNPLISSRMTILRTHDDHVHVDGCSGFDGSQPRN
jgi:hypothetical protein